MRNQIFNSPGNEEAELAGGWGSLGSSLGTLPISISVKIGGRMCPQMTPQFRHPCVLNQLRSRGSQGYLCSASYYLLLHTYQASLKMMTDEIRHSIQRLLLIEFFRSALKKFRNSDFDLLYNSSKKFTFSDDDFLANFSQGAFTNYVYKIWRFLTPSPPPPFTFSMV